MHEGILLLMEVVSVQLLPAKKMGDILKLCFGTFCVATIIWTGVNLYSWYGNKGVPIEQKVKYGIYLALGLVGIVLLARFP